MSSRLRVLVGHVRTKTACAEEAPLAALPTANKVALAGAVALGAAALLLRRPTPDWHTGREWEAFLAEYDKRMEDFAEGTVATQVKTKFGVTQVYLCGPEDGQPVMLIPGLTATSTIFAQGGHVKGLAQALASAGHRVFSVDVITDLGRSVPLGVARSPRQPKDWAGWVFQVVDGLNVQGQIDILGYSLGAWIGSQAAALEPQRVRRYIALAPAAIFAPIHWTFYIHSIFLFIPSQALAEWGLRQMGGDDSFIEDVASWFTLGARIPRFLRYGMPGPPGVISDEMIRALPPTRLLIGENETVTSAQDAMDRLRAFPNVEPFIVKGAGHIFTVEEAAIVREAVTSFLA
jgi:pimeloyl-ACP methyl ester carboxylesterase